MQIQKIIIDNNINPVIIKQIHNINKKTGYNSIWQTIEWNIMQKTAGYIEKGFLVGVFEGEKLLNYAIIERRGIGLSLFANFIIGGIINEKGLDLLEKEIISIGNNTGVVFTQIENLEELNFKNFKSGFYKNFIEKNTAVIDLSVSEDSILANMKQKGRYNIKIAQKNGVEVKKVENTQENIDIFYNLLNETKERDEFSINSKGFFEKFIHYLYKNNSGGLYFAYKDGEVVVSGIFVFYGNVCQYYYGASTSDNTKRKYMASYLLQWHVILEAKNAGYKLFDFLGIADPKDKKSHLIGVTDFKLKLTNSIKIFPSSKIFIHKKIFFFLFKILRSLKRIY